MSATAPARAIAKLPFRFANLLIGRHLARRYPLAPLMPVLAGRTVVLVGTGPSLDLVPLDVVRDAEVVLLNNAPSVRQRFHRSNRYHWFASDSYGIARLIGEVPADIRRIVMPHIHAGVAHIARSLRDGDVYLHVPGRLFLGGPETGAPRRPTLGTHRASLGDSFLRDPLEVPWRLGILPHTVMLNAMAVFASLGAGRGRSACRRYRAADAVAGLRQRRGAAVPRPNAEGLCSPRDSGGQLLACVP